jgi:integrase
MKLTTESVAGLRLPAGKIEHFEWDDSLPGFGVRIRGGGRRWVVQYRFGRRQRRESLGDIRKVKLGDARKIARQRFAQVELGVDPAAERAQAHTTAAAAALTLGSVVARYLAAKQDVLRPSTFKAAKRYFTTQWKPFTGRPLDSIKRSDVAARLQEIIKEHGRTSAGRARGNLSALFAWAMKEGLCEDNPVIATHDPEEGILPRDRVLTDLELALVWKESGVGDFGPIVKLLILTGCRREEIGGLKWSEIDLESGVLTIPGERTKNHRTHVLTLPSIAIDILRSIEGGKARAHAFGARDGGFHGWSFAKVSLDQRITIATKGNRLPRWTLHDLRRTMRTGLGKIGVQPHIAELAINHVRGGVEAIYDRHRYEREIKAALALWADHVLTLVNDGERKVIALARVS